jgi:hypothetical protein
MTKAKILKPIALILISSALGIASCSERDSDKEQLLRAAEVHLNAYYSEVTANAKLTAMTAYLRDWEQVDREGYLAKSPKFLFETMLFIHLRLAALNYQTGDNRGALRELAFAAHLQKRAELSSVLQGLDLDDPRSLPLLVEKIKLLDSSLAAQRK